MARRELPEINAGSMADIAFLLLVFFLVTTTINKPEEGLYKELPVKKDERVKTPPVEVVDRNVITVLANKQNNLLLDEKYPLKASEVDKLYDITIAFLGDHSKAGDPNRAANLGIGQFPVRREVTIQSINDDLEYWKNIETEYEAAEIDATFAKVMIKKTEKRLDVRQRIGSFYALPQVCFIQFRSDKGTSYGFYIQALDKMNSALKDVRNAYTQEQWGVDYAELDPNDDKDKVRIVKELYPDIIRDKTD